MIIAMTRVFATPELIEAILVQLPLRDLLLAQVVSPGWSRTISSSPIIQQKLFFTPTSAKRGKGADPDFNPLLMELLPPFFLGSSEDPSPWNCQDFHELCSQPWVLDDVRRVKVLREDASWRKMFPMQPARRVGEIEMWGGCQCGGFQKEIWGVKGVYMLREMGIEEGCVMRRDEGTTMGFLFDLVVWIRDEWPWVTFCVDLGVPYSDPDSEDGDEDVGDEAEQAVEDVLPFGSEETDRNEEGVEDGGFRIVIGHSQECYSGRGDVVTPCGLMIRGFKKDPIELLKEAEEW
ncbi:hypothetical protein DL98DRAFT_522394 [Cadophora sp. DSE1049]|nr:hypothetical protein DL98DRAFT_522394 [Cadophora sp. DSE1049]